MSQLAVSTQFQCSNLAFRVMGGTVAAWFTIAALGHWIFLAYILAVFYPPIAQHGLDGLAGLHLPSGFRDGDTLGNFAAASHVLLAAVVIGGGPLQLVPQLRRRVPVFHRYLGRSYMLAAVLSAIGGLWVVWTRGTVGNLFSHLSTSIDALLIAFFAGQTLRHAVARRITLHRRWALRLFMAGSAVWFFRVGLMSWVMLTGGVGIDFESFTGPAIHALGLAQYLLPLGMLQWYFRCQDHVSDRERMSFACTLAGLTVIMALGIFAATVGMWFPRS